MKEIITLGFILFVFFPLFIAIKNILIQIISDHSKQRRADNREEIEDRFNDIFKQYKPLQGTTVSSIYIDREDILERKSIYLSSSEWKAKRDIILERDGYRCQLCYLPDNLNVHHITYDNLFKEKDEELVVLCSICHTALHEELGYELDGYYPIK